MTLYKALLAAAAIRTYVSAIEAVHNTWIAIMRELVVYFLASSSL